jgi:hypothetical protein
MSLVLTALVLTSYTATANASHRHEKDPCTQLWVYTVQKGPCIVFKHPSGHESEKVNKANIEFNVGVETGHLRTHVYCKKFYQSTQLP